MTSIATDEAQTFNAYAEIVGSLANKGKFRKKEASYDKFLGGVDEGIEYVATFKGRTYIIERYVSDPEQMDLIQENIFYYNLTIKDGDNQTLELDDDAFEEKRERLFYYVAERSKTAKTMKAHKDIMDRMRGE